MSQMFAYKWSQNEGEAYTNGEPTENFIRWCKETSHMDIEAWRRAFECVVRIKKQAARDGTEKDCWPPDSVTFVEYGRPPSKMYKVFDQSNALESKALPKAENISRMAALMGSLGSD